MTTELEDKLKQAFDEKNNDIKSFTWKFARKEDGTQDEIRLYDATEEQLKKFYNHCQSMLYNPDKNNPGRYVLLDIIAEQRKNCTIELFIRGLESGELCEDHNPYPRYLYLPDIRAFMNQNKEDFPANKLDKLSIASLTGNLPRQYQRLSIAEVTNGLLNQLGIINTKHITFSFIINMGIYLSPSELKEFDEKDSEGKTRSKLEVIKERLGLNKSVRLIVKPSGLNYKELRAMLKLKPKNYSELTTDQLTVLSTKVLFKLENEILNHIAQWEEKIRQINLVAQARNISL